ncbi:helix-turn-helix domain-containing protein [Allosphingosinicella sp.]|uniref:MerR family transcriptional regulator n=1 Tax=Allosphingosinicella sp. TaxID=2823234 RepID=UPI0037844FD8
MANLAIGALARRTGVNIETIRYFERVGLLDKPDRTEGGHRVYSEQHIRALSFIKRSRDLGFAQDEVRAILSLGGPDGACCDEVRDIASRHLEKVRHKLADLARLEHLLATTVDRCSGGHVPNCPVIDMLDSRSST